MTDDARARVEALDDAALEAFAAAHAVAPPLELRARVLAAVEREVRAQRAARGVRRWRAAAAGLAAAACVLGALLAREVSVGRENAALVSALRRGGAEFLAELQARESEIVSRGQALQVHAEVIRILSSPHLRSAVLDPTAGHSGTARVLLDPDSGALAVVGAGLPPPEPGKAYQLWAIRGDAPPERAGDFAIAPDRKNFAIRLREVRAPLEVTSFAITLESAAGVASPSGPIVFAGALGS
jgi:hypothetical protein